MTAPTLCDSCSARCCRLYAIPVTHLDVERIVGHTLRPASEFVEASAVDFADEMPVAYLDGQPSQLVLRRGEDGDACVFLQGDRCRIHAYAPSVCRMYPYVACRDDQLQLRQRRDVYCEGDFALDEAGRGRLMEVSDRFWNQELDGYRALVQKWNLMGGPGDAEAFLAFCRHNS
jgi:Fe-S-cluster containining protein